MHAVGLVAIHGHDPPVAHHVYVDGSYYRQNEQARAFVVILEDVMGNVCLMGFAVGYLSELQAAQFEALEVDNIFVEAASLFHAI